MQIITNIDQGSEEWLKLRMGSATASNFNYIVTSKGDLSKSINDYALKLASELLTLEPEESYKSQDMIRGNELEPEARESYQEYMFNLVDQVSFIKTDCGNIGYSPDGLVSNNGLIEIKCPNQKTHTKYLYNDKLPTECIQQVQGGLMVSEREWCDFVSYHPNFIEGKKIFLKRIYRDEIFIKNLRIGLDRVIELRDNFLEKIKEY